MAKRLEPVSTCGHCRRPHMWCPIKWRQMSSCDESAGDYKRHVWDKIEPVWTKIRDRVWTKQATGLPYDALFRRLFLHEYTEESRWLENSYRGQHWGWVQQQWRNCQTWFAEQAVARFPSQWVSALYLHGLDQLDVLAWQWMDQHENLLEQVW